MGRRCESTRFVPPVRQLHELAGGICMHSRGSLSHEWNNFPGLAVIAGGPGERAGGYVVEDHDVWWECYRTFLLWRTGEVVDAVLNGGCNMSTGACARSVHKSSRRSVFAAR